MRNSLLAISSGEWLLLAGGLILGTCLWLFINRKIIHPVILSLEERGARPNPIAFCESAMGFVMLIVNGGLLYLATQLPDYFLFSFSLAGILLGGWVALPADR